MIKLKELIPNKAFKKLYEYIDLYSHRRNVDEYLESFKKELESKRGGSYEMDSVEYETDRWENDSKILKKELVNQIYTFPEKRIFVVHDIDLTENFLIYIDKIENVAIGTKIEEYKKYLNLSKIKITSELFNTYENYIKKKYKVDINYKSLEAVKNYFN